MNENKDYRYLTEEEILYTGSTLLRKRFKEIGDTKDGLLSKGSIGQFVEEKAFHYSPNSDSSPDFLTANIELKVTPIKKNNNGSYSAKERLVLSIINYVEEAKKSFETSTFWQKSSSLYILFYQWEPNKKREDFQIVFDYLLRYPEEDLLIIRNDWKIIHDKILTGKAHEISEADTMYLAACTKGVNSLSTRNQPYSDIPAKQRAYSLKTSYMTHLLRTKIIPSQDPAMRLITDVQDLEKQTFEQVIYNRLKPYFGMKVSDLKRRYNLNETKNINEIIIAKLLGVDGKVSKTEEFQKANIVPKTIRLEKNNRIIESMSFPTFKYEEIVEQQWEDSDLRDYFDSTKFMFIVFKRVVDDYELHNIVFWNMPYEILEKEVKKVWEDTKQVIKSGNIVKHITQKGKRLTNFPKMNDSSVMHVRPHAQDAEDTYRLPFPDKLTGDDKYVKHCFWLNNNYIKYIIT